MKRILVGVVAGALLVIGGGAATARANDGQNAGTSGIVQPTPSDPRLPENKGDAASAGDAAAQEYLAVNILISSCNQRICWRGEGTPAAPLRIYLRVAPLVVLNVTYSEGSGD